MIKLTEAPALTIATYRLTLATLILTPLVLIKKKAELLSLTKRDLTLCLGAGIFLAIHFIAWVSSLQFTSVASSVVLVTTNPIFVGLGSWFILKEKLTKLLIIGIFLSVVGGILIGYGDFSLGSHKLTGDLLALSGALMMSGYLLTGRKVRQKTDLLVYIFVVYAAASLILLVASLITTQQFFGYSNYTYLMLVLLALGPQLLGHTSFNWALKYLSASVVAVAILGEPIGSTILAYFILGEGLTGLKVAGGLFVICGIYLATRVQH